MKIHVKQRYLPLFAVLAALVVGTVIVLPMLFSRKPAATGQDEPVNRTIYLSPSVQYNNLYAVGDTTEGDEMQALADELELLLTEAGFTVRRNDPEGTLEDAVKRSNRIKPGLHLALHTNASQDASIRGCEVFVKQGGSSESRKLAQNLEDAITDLGIKSRGVKKTRELYELNQVEAETAVLLEIEFHDHPDGARWLLDNRTKLAETIAAAVITYYAS